jgi:hypothetical protein
MVTSLLSWFVLSVRVGYPLKSLYAGCDWCGTPEVSMYESRLWFVETMDLMPPRVEAVGVGRSEAPIVDHAGAADLLPSPVCVKNCLVVVVFPPSRTGAELSPW